MSLIKYIYNDENSIPTVIVRYGAKSVKCYACSYGDGPGTSYLYASDNTQRCLPVLIGKTKNPVTIYDKNMNKIGVIK